MSQHPNRAGLSDRLKELQQAEGPLNSPGFGVDDIVRGGRRRHRRRTVVQIAAAVVAVAALGTGISVSQAPDSGNGSFPVAAPSAVPTPALPAVDLDEAVSLTYRKAGKTVTVTQKGIPVTTITLQSASRTATSGRVIFVFDADRDLTVDTTFFVLYDAKGGENTAEAARVVTLAAGEHSLELSFRETHDQPEAVGWAPSDGEAIWEFTE